MKVFTKFKSTSGVNELNKKDWKRWFRNVILFASPAIIAVLIALQGFITNENNFPNQTQIVFALGAGYSAFLASLIDLLQKYRSG